MVSRTFSTLIFPQWGRVNLKNKTPHKGRLFSGGEGGIRTREPLWVTRFPSVRAKPDYATSPFQTRRLYHKDFKRFLIWAMLF